jgi:hypothetical protein
VASGLTPLDAVLSNPNGGADQAERFGWNGPFEVAEDASSRFTTAEELTDRLMARHLDVLSDDELSELNDLVATAHRHLLG